MKTIHRFCLVVLLALIAVTAQAQTPVNIRQVGDTTVTSPLPVITTQGPPLTTAGWPVYTEVCSGTTCYTSPVNYGATVIASGSTSTITSVTTSIDAGSFCNNQNSGTVTLNMTDGNNVYIHGIGFSIPANSSLSFTDIAGSIFTSGIRMSASAASAITCWIRGHQ